MKYLAWLLLPLLSMLALPGLAGTQNILDQVHTIVFVGDSLTDGADWPDWVINTLRGDQRYPELTFYNAGVGGNHISDVKARLSADVLALHPDLVVMLAGTNDASPAVNYQAYRQDFNDVVRTLRENKIKVLLLTPPTVKSPETCDRLSKLNEIIREIATKYDCPVADTRAVFDAAIAVGGTPVGDDGVHHTREGWQLMGRTVLVALGGKLPLHETVVLDRGIITDWYISPSITPVDLPTPTTECSITFDPIKAGWRKYDAATEKKSCVWWRAGSFDRGAVYFFGDPKRQDNAAAYACATVTVDKETPTTMRIGGNVPLIVWLNGKLVWNGKVWHGWHADTDRFPVTLQQGENRILVYGSSAFYLALNP